MEKNTGTFSWKTLLIIAGSYVSFGIGAGFATGSEVLQFWAPHGLPAIAGIIISSILILVCIAVVSRDCRISTTVENIWEHSSNGSTH